MTVIAFDGKTLASDSLITFGSGFIHGNDKKLFRLKSGGMLGCAGDADSRAVISLLDNVKDEADLPSKAELEGTKTEGEFLLVLPDKSTWAITIECDEKGRWIGQVLTFKSHPAIGHGQDFAKAALYLGKTAEEAVKVACKFSAACGLPLQTMKLGDRPKEKIKRVRKPKEIHDAE